ncbi:hypothetical protein WJX81_003487 [Elliptochloris bilobata]|uniref:CBF1-interacting co-repressor CIR N-terminal domain-containing protein n=1 Tax=Elliptochloris bilobata TaxID=381761 RepID=A0AAW1QAE2_9CHLO
MGGGLTFLNKKTWHPGRMQNQEEKWKREQAAEKEAKKLAEIRTQIEQERQNEELHQVAVSAGVKSQADRLDWMYSGGMVAKQEADKRAEEQLLGVRPVELAEAAAPSKAEAVAQLPTFYAEDTPASANELWSRLHSDPLFAIRQQEIAARRSVAKNPVKMDAIKREVAQAKAAQAAPVADVKLDKRARNEAKKEAKRAKRDAEIAAAHAGRDLRYGLNHAEAAQGYGRSDLAASTRQRLEEAARKKEEEAREKAAQRYTRTEYKTGRLTAEERTARLAEMAGNADVHEEARWSRLRTAKAADAEEEARAERAGADRGGAHHADTAGFLQAATREAYGLGTPGNCAPLRNDAQMYPDTSETRSISQESTEWSRFQDLLADVSERIVPEPLRKASQAAQARLGTLAGLPDPIDNPTTPELRALLAGLLPACVMMDAVYEDVTAWDKLTADVRFPLQGGGPIRDKRRINAKGPYGSMQRSHPLQAAARTDLHLTQKSPWDTIAYVVAFQAPTPPTTAAFVFRATDWISVTNYASDLDAVLIPYPGCDGCRVHAGFLRAFQSLTDPHSPEGNIGAAWSDLSGGLAPSSVLCAGYSRGCTLAFLCALWAKQTYGAAVKAEVVTMGCPAAGNAAFVAHYNAVMSADATYRITNHADVIPSLLPRSAGYRFVGAPIWLYRLGSHFPGNYSAYAMERPAWFTGKLSDHYPGYRYILPIEQITGLNISRYSQPE